MTPSVRPMQTTDLDNVYTIELAAHRAPWSREILSDCLLIGYDCRVIDIDNNPQAGLASYIMCRYDDTICHVLNICVAPALQHKGYGQSMLQAVIDSPAKADVSTILLEVRPSNLPALQLYKKMGFQQAGIKRGYYREGPGIEDAVVLQKQIIK